MQLEWKIEVGHIVSLGVLVLGFAVQYGSLSTRLTAVETQAARAVSTNETLVLTLSSLNNTIIKVQTQMDEREKRFDAAQAAQNLKMDQRELHNR